MSGRCAVAGSPVAHSLSPVLWRAAFAELGLDWEYGVEDCGPADLPALVARLRSEPGWRALSLTRPLKEAAVGCVDDLHTPLGAVNTITVGADGRLAGHNTDVAGIRAAVSQARVDLTDSWVGVLGGGGTARAVIGALAGTAVGEVELAVRTPRPELAQLAARLGVPLRLSGWERAWELVHAADLVISTLPPGAGTDVAADWWRPAALVDVTYDPWPTPLAASAAQSGATVVDGRCVLVGQAVEAITLATGRRPDPAALTAAIASPPVGRED
jgi:shikimate dehydrogenase